MTRSIEQWLVTAPQETFEAILDVVAERSKQEQLGWTPEHDDKYGVTHLLIEAYERMPAVALAASVGGESGARDGLVVLAALLVAAIETHDRRARMDPPSADQTIEGCS